ncbi:MAG: preprotein translocase subunit YajC [Chlamydiia bacterium]|nr:preprotein translocase subunit YajC [Chlamydiia bacterium]
MKKVLFLLAPLTLFAEEAAPAARQQSMWQTLMMIGIALLFFYMILWRPEQKRRKKMKQQRESMRKGDRITAMGIVGTLVRVEQETVILKMVDGAKIEVLKAAISDVKPGAADSAESSEPQANGA